jgi:hypothetical protein
MEGCADEFERHIGVDSDHHFLLPWNHEKRSKFMINGLRGTHIATNIPVDIPLNSKQMQLALDKDPNTMNDSWDMVCDVCVDNGFIDPRGNVHIDFIVINGVQKVFH